MPPAQRYSREHAVGPIVIGKITAVGIMDITGLPSDMRIDVIDGKTLKSVIQIYLV